MRELVALLDLQPDQADESLIKAVAARISEVFRLQGIDLALQIADTVCGVKPDSATSTYFKLSKLVTEEELSIDLFIIGMHLMPPGVFENLFEAVRRDLDEDPMPDADCRDIHGEESFSLDTLASHTNVSKNEIAERTANVLALKAHALSLKPMHEEYGMLVDANRSVGNYKIVQA